MKREIKFRAWQKDGTGMIDLQKITPLIINQDQSGVFLPFNKDIYLMQYTGLKDKNGKEIYEGDKLAWEGWVRIVAWDNEKSMYVFTNNINRDEDFPLFNYFEADFEIIGNIYEIK